MISSTVTYLTYDLLLIYLQIVGLTQRTYELLTIYLWIWGCECLSYLCKKRLLILLLFYLSYLSKWTILILLMITYATQCAYVTYCTYSTVMVAWWDKWDLHIIYECCTQSQVLYVVPIISTSTSILVSLRHWHHPVLHAQRETRL